MGASLVQPIYEIKYLLPRGRIEKQLAKLEPEFLI
jgi:hypothetical protein